MIFRKSVLPVHALGLFALFAASACGQNPHFVDPGSSGNATAPRSNHPVIDPSASPSVDPSASPSSDPSANPSSSPSAGPSVSPSPSTDPSASPSPIPTVTVTASPSPAPTVYVSPSPVPTVTVTASPAPSVVVVATPGPTVTVTASPSPAPTVTASASPAPTVTVTASPSPDPVPTVTVSVSPDPSPSPSPSPTDEAHETKLPVNCDQLAALIRSSEDGAGNVTDEVLPDGTCVIHSNRYPGGTPYPVGTTLVPSTTDDGTVIYIVRDPSGHEVETFYMYNDEVIAIVYYYVIPGDASSGTPDRVVPKSLVTRLFHFDTGKWDILPSEKPIEKVVASAIEDVAKAEGSSLQVIEVQGHTDDVGGKEMNLVLSKKRADEVRLVLLKELNSSSFTPQIPWEQFLVARGLGSSQTISGPSGHRNGYAVFTARDRTLNRRVEIHFNY